MNFNTITASGSPTFIYEISCTISRDTSNFANINVNFTVKTYLKGSSSATWLCYSKTSSADNAYAVKLKTKISTSVGSATKTVFIKDGREGWIAGGSRSGCIVVNSNNKKTVNFTISCLAKQAKNLTFEFSGVRGTGASSSQTAGTFTKTILKSNVIAEVYTVTYNKGNFPGTTYTLPKDNNYYLSGTSVTIDPKNEAVFLIPEGYIFQGWSINGVLQKQSSFSISKNTTLTATFKEQQKHILSYSFTGEIPPNVFPPQAESHVQGERQIVLKSVAPVPYYIFQGWKQSGSNQIITAIDEMPNEDITIEGNWKRERRYIQIKTEDEWEKTIVYLKNEASFPYVEAFPFIKTQQGWKTTS